MIALDCVTTADGCLEPVRIHRHPKHRRRQAGKGLHLDRDGYPRVWAKGRQHLLHRLVASWVIGDVGKEVDHLCRNRRCVRPEHLAIVSRAEHLERHRQLRAAA